MNYKKLTEDKNELITRAETILNTAKEAEKELSEDEINEVRDLHKRAKKIDEEIKLREENEAMINNLKEDKETNVEVRSEEKSVEISDREAFDNFIRGKSDLKTRATLSNMTFSDNTAVIPKTIADEIIRKVYDICPILERSTRYNVKGTLEIPYYPALNDGNYDNITVAYQNEFSEIASTTGKFSTIELTGFLAGALTKISKSLINNAQFDVVNFIVNEMSQQISRFIEGELIHGTSQKVSGLSTLSNSLTAASTSVITADEVIQLKDKVKDVYQNNGIFIMSPATRTALRLLKDQRGMYLLQDDITSPFGSVLLGRPVFVSENMENMAAGKITIFYGDMTGLATKFSEEINIQVLREHYAAMHAIGVVGFFEFDSKVINEQKIAKLVMAAA